MLSRKNSWKKWWNKSEFQNLDLFVFGKFCNCFTEICMQLCYCNYGSDTQILSFTRMWSILDVVFISLGLMSSYFLPPLGRLEVMLSWICLHKEHTWLHPICVCCWFGVQVGDCWKMNKRKTLSLLLEISYSSSYYMTLVLWIDLGIGNVYLAISVRHVRRESKKRICQQSKHVTPVSDVGLRFTDRWKMAISG